MEVEKYIKIIANENQVHTLPDSSKVWLEPGSSIEYIKSFNENRKVKLSGNALFEVYKHQGSTFQVYINNAFIEVKGTCFLVKQDNINLNEITLLNGSIDFNIETTKEKILMKPMQKMIYDSQKGQAEVKDIEDVHWENGKFHLNEMPLKQLIQTINQLYNTNIILKENIKKESAFTGTIRYNEELNDVLNKVCFSLNLNIEYNKNQIIIY